MAINGDKHSQGVGNIQQLGLHKLRIDRNANPGHEFTGPDRNPMCPLTVIHPPDQTIGLLQLPAVVL